jgi:hypothetical protein
VPAPQYNIPYAYSVNGFQQLPFRWQKEYAFRCGKSLETDAFGEAQPLSEEVKKSFQMQIDEFDREKRLQTANALEAPPPKPKAPYRKPPASWRNRSRSCHSTSKDDWTSDAPLPHPVPATRPHSPVAPPRPSTSSAPPGPPAEVLISPHGNRLLDTPPPTPSPVVSNKEKREDLDQTFIKRLLKEKADSLTKNAIAANARKVALQEQGEAVHARAHKAELARAALDRPADIIIEMIEERVAALRKEAEVFEADARVAEMEARKLFAEASATQGTADRY